MSDKILGILVPYYKNSEQCKVAFQQLMKKLNKQVDDNMILYIYEDGQYSSWLREYKNKNIIIESDVVNKGVSHARNKGLDYLVNKVRYILFLDSDDDVSDNYLSVILDHCMDNTHEVIESTFYVNDQKASFNPRVIRSGAAGSAIQTKIIGNIRFNEDLQIAEDTTFMNTVIDLTKHRKVHAKTNYIYQYGINQNSLIMRYNRKEIKEER